MASENFPKPLKQCRPLFELGRHIGSPPSRITEEDAVKLESQEGKAPSLRLQIDIPAFVFVDLNSEFCQLLPQSRFHRPYQPVMLRMSVYQNHQIIRETCILDSGVFAVPRGFDRLFQHSIYLVEIDVTEPRGNNPALRNAHFPGGFQDHLE